MASFCRRLISVTKADAASNIYWIERNAKPILVQVNERRYELWHGRCLMGMSIFHDGKFEWGWRFYPRQPSMRPSRKLHRSAEATVRGRFGSLAVSTLSLGQIA